MTTDIIERLPMSTATISEDRIARLREIFPEAFRDGRIDFDVLRRLLGEQVDTGKERFGLHWPGKADCLRVIQEPSVGTLLPMREESVNFDSTENLIIEGDNLEVLKLLQKSYYSKVKLIYIDPPYNTGNEFIYPDNFREGLQDYLKYSGQVDAEGFKTATNTEASGRFHSKWLSMMYPRLFLARNLLRDDGLILISIDDNEVDNLKKLCGEIFGEENFCCQFVWHTEGNTDNQNVVKVAHEYVLAYYKNATYADSAIGHVIDPNTPKESNLWKGIADNNINKNGPANPPDTIELPAGFPCSEQTLSYRRKELDDEFFRITRQQKFISEETQDKYQIEKKSGLPVKLDNLEVEDFKLVRPCRIYGGTANKNKLLEFIRNGCRPIVDDGTPLRFYINSNAAVRYVRDNERPRNILSVLRGLGTTERTKTYLKGLGIYYDYPKPVGLLQYLIRVGCELDGVVLDFFAGSATTAEAVLVNNNEGKSSQRFILVQLPEPTGRADFPTIATITRERTRRVIRKLEEADSGRLPLEKPSGRRDRGFRALKLAASNFKPWDGSNENLAGVAETLELFADHVVAGRSAEEILTEVLLKAGFPLTAPIVKLNLAGKEVFSVAEGALLVCLDRELTIEVIEAMVERSPAQIVCLDAGFQRNDQLKVNAVQAIKSRARNEETTIVLRVV